MGTATDRPYERFSADDLILRDELALERTVLANERTLLSYVRTALAFAVTGAGIIKFLDGAMVGLLGGSIIGCAILVAGLGVHRYQSVARRIRISRGPVPPASRPPGTPG
jgi:putative membrane protein